MKIITLFLLMTLSSYAAIGKVYAINGKATIVSGNKKEAVVLGSSIDVKDSIKTSKDTKLQIIFKDQTVVTLGRNSHLSIDAYHFDGSSNSQARLRLNKGVIKAMSGKLAKLSPDALQVHTANAQVGVRGTTFVLRTNKKQTILATISGMTVLKDKKSNTSYTVEADQQLIKDHKTANVKKRALDQRTIRLGKRMVKQSSKSQTHEGSSVVTQRQSSVSTTGSVQAVVIQNIENVVGNEQVNEKVIVKGEGPFSYGYWKSNSIATIGFASGIDVTSSMVANYTSGALTADYSGGVVSIRDGVAATNGSFYLYADFTNMQVNGNINFTDSKNQYWAANLNPVSITNEDFKFAGPAGLTTTGTVALDPNTSRLEGSFYGTGTGQPILNQDGVAGTFVFKGTDGSGATSVTGSFGGTVYNVTGGL